MKRTTFIAAALVAASAWSMGSFAQTTPSAGTVTVGPNGESVFPGQTEAVAMVKVPAGMKGQLAEIDAKEGQAVKKGDVLAKLDDSIQQATVELAKQKAESTVEIRGAENQVKFAQNEFDRISTIGSASASEKQQKKLQLEQSKLSLEKEQEGQKLAQLDLKREQITLDHMTIKSPLDGSILRVNKRPGEETDEDPLITIVQTSRLSAIFFLPKQVFGKIHVGDKAALHVEDKTREASVIAVDPILDNEIFRVKMEFDNTDGTIPAGSAATWMWKDAVGKK